MKTDKVPEHWVAHQILDMDYTSQRRKRAEEIMDPVATRAVNIRGLVVPSCRVAEHLTVTIFIKCAWLECLVCIRRNWTLAPFKF
jgi:hypothetical protein